MSTGTPRLERGLLLVFSFVGLIGGVFGALRLSDIKGLENRIDTKIEVNTTAIAAVKSDLGVEREDRISQLSQFMVVQKQFNDDQNARIDRVQSKVETNTYLLMQIKSGLGK